MSRAEEMRRYRATHPETKNRDRELAQARKSAVNQLIDAHPGEYTVLLDAVCDAMGIDPPGSRPNGRPRRGAE